MLDFDTLNINLGLERVEKVLNELGNPHQKFKSIHVAGTNGKGSVCAMLASILKEVGFKVGLFTSPHLYKWNERIKINGVDIADTDLDSLTKKVVAYNPRMNSGASFPAIPSPTIHCGVPERSLTQFEIITCVAFQYFAEQQVDYAVVEVGMGGRLDATNVITPEISVITNVDLDHTEYLGNTLKEIAFEKSGIIKNGVTLVTAETKPEVLEIIKSSCKMRDASIVEVTREMMREASGGLLGDYQRINEAVAIKVSELLAVSRKQIEAGLKNTKWPGRFQIVSESPLIIVDGAHNPAGAVALIESLKELNIEKPFTLILGFQSYKDIDSMLKIYSSFSKNILLTKSSHPQSADLSSYQILVTRYYPKLSNAINEAKVIGAPVVIAGSLFLIAEAIEYLKLDSDIPLL